MSNWTKSGRTFRARGEDTFHLSVGDLMAALLLIVILLLIATVTRLSQEYARAQENNDRITEIAQSYENTRQALYEALSDEFSEDFEDWNAVLEEDLTIHFSEASTFEPNSGIIRSDFRMILQSFVPRYFGILYREQFRDNVTEVQIEGHTANPGEAYGFVESMELAYRRSYNVLSYSFAVLRNWSSFAGDDQFRTWVESKAGAAAFSHGRPLPRNGPPNWEISRRVDFRVLTNAEEQIEKILEDE